MSYQSPIELFQTQFLSYMEGRIIDTIYEAVMNVGVSVDKEELLKALDYDRYQYEKGYADREQEIVQCKDCKHGEPCYEYVYCTKDIGKIESSVHKPDWFCADGKWRDDND